MSSLERKIVEKILDNINIIFFVFITLFGLALRYYGRDFITDDMYSYFLPWFYKIKDLGGLQALSTQVGDYSILYQSIIALLTYIDANPLYMYKALSTIFDLVLAFSSACLISCIKKESNFSLSFNIVYGLVLCLPIFVFDSSYWGQCDSMYVSFIVISLLMLYKNKYIASFILLGIALSLKLQTIFIVPFYFLDYIKEKKYSILYFIIPILVLLISGLPGVFFGRNILSPISIYLNQATSVKSMSFNFNSFWNLIGGEYRWLKWMSITLTLAILIGIIYIIVKKDGKVYTDNKLSIAVLLTWTTLLFLPNMHERYNHLLATLLVIQLVLDRKYYASIVISLVFTTMTYAWALFGWSPYNEGVTQLTTIVSIFAYFLYVRTLTKDNN